MFEWQAPYTSDKLLVCVHQMYTYTILIVRSFKQDVYKMGSQAQDSQSFGKGSRSPRETCPGDWAHGDSHHQRCVGSCGETDTAYAWARVEEEFWAKFGETIAVQKERQKLSKINPWELPSTPINFLQPIPISEGIYFVIYEHYILYVGKSLRMRARWQKHHLTNKIQAAFPGARIFWLQVSLTGKPNAYTLIDGLLNDLESIFYHKYLPPFNSLVPKKRTEVLTVENFPSLSVACLNDITGIHGLIWEQWMNNCPEPRMLALIIKCGVGIDMSVEELQMSLRRGSQNRQLTCFYASTSALKTHRKGKKIITPYKG